MENTILPSGKHYIAQCKALYCPMENTILPNGKHYIAQCKALYCPMENTILSSGKHYIAQCKALYCPMENTILPSVKHYIAQWKTPHSSIACQFDVTYVTAFTRAAAFLSYETLTAQAMVSSSPCGICD